MPRAKKSDASKGAETKKNSITSEPEWGGFLNLRLTDEHKVLFDTWHEASQQTVGTLLDDAMIDGIKVSLAYDTENECYIATFTGSLIPAHNTRYAASSRAGTYWEALALMCWKHFVLAEGNWFDYLPHSGTFKRWG
jgi:hypothetical protein